MLAKVDKAYAGKIITFIDIIVSITLVVFIAFLKTSQKTWLAKYKDQTVELDDFTIEMTNLPNDIEYGDDEDTLKACIYQHFESLVERIQSEPCDDEEEHKDIELQDIDNPNEEEKKGEED